MKYIYKIAFILFFCVSYFPIANAELINTQIPASQLMFHYDNSSTNSADAFLTITNTSVAESVNIHVQILDKDCLEVDFFDKLTPADTHTYDMDDIRLDCFDPDDIVGTNAQCVDQDRASGATAGGKRGMVFITAIDKVNSPNPIPFPHLIGTTLNIEFGGAYATYINAVGRDFDGTNFNQLSDTETFIAAFDRFDAPDGGHVNDRIILTGLAWADSFGSPRPGYQPVSSSASGVLDIIDEIEVPLSCQTTGFACIESGAPTDAFENSTGVIGCGESTIATGLFDMFNASVTDNAVLIESVYVDDSIAIAGADYAIHVVALDIDITVDCEAIDPCSDLVNCTPECRDDTCTDLASCTGDTATLCAGVEVVQGAVCDGVGGATEIDCDDGFDNDVNTFADCKDEACADLEVCDTGGTGGGGGGGCSVAAATTGLGSMANALVLLIPAFGIGVRRIRRRLSK